MPEEYDPLNTSVADFDTTKDPEVEQGLKEPDQEPAKSTVPDAPEPEAKVEPEAKGSEVADGGELGPDAELADLGFPALPADLAENEDIARRYHETQFGIQKVLRQTQETKEALSKYADVAAKLENPATAREAFLALAEIQKRETGIDPLAEFRRTETRQEIDIPSDWEGFTLEQYEEAQELGCEYPSEYRTAKKLEARMEAKFKPYEQEREQARAQNATEQFLSQEAPRVMGFLSKTENGWPVTKEMVAKAYTEFPNLKDDLALAVMKTFPREYASHKASVVLKAQGTEGPELLTKGGTGSKGAVLHTLDPEADSVDLIHLIAENQAATR